MSAKEESLFAQQLQAVQQHTQTLYQNAQEVPWREPEVVIYCLEELRSALEELRIAEEGLRAQNEALLAAKYLIEAERRRYQELFEFAPDGYLVTNPFGVVQEANQVVAQLFNISQRHLIGKPLVNFVPDDQRRAFRALLNQLPTIHRVQEWELRLQGRDNDVFDAALTVETVRDREGQATALRWLIRDVTTRKQAEEQLRRVQMQNIELIEADRLKSQFIATISHELRTPMHAILGFSEMLMRRFHQQQDPQTLRMAECIFRNGKNLLSLIEEMLDFSSLRASTLELRPETLDLVECVTQTIEELRPLALQKALDLHVCASPAQIHTAVDRNRLRQILTNLVSNAVKFTDFGSVTVELQQQPETIVLCVRDTGIGISPADCPRIFQGFWQANQSITRPYSGTGLGLAIVKELVDLMGGSISVESQVGQGSTFRVELPSAVIPFEQN